LLAISDNMIRMLHVVGVLEYYGGGLLDLK